MKKTQHEQERDKRAHLPNTSLLFTSLLFSPILFLDQVVSGYGGLDTRWCGVLGIENTKEEKGVRIVAWIDGDRCEWGIIEWIWGEGKW